MSMKQLMHGAQRAASRAQPAGRSVKSAGWIETKSSRIKKVEDRRHRHGHWHKTENPRRKTPWLRNARWNFPGSRFDRDQAWVQHGRAQVRESIKQILYFRFGQNHQPPNANRNSDDETAGDARNHGDNVGRHAQAITLQVPHFDAAEKNDQSSNEP